MTREEINQVYEKINNLLNKIDEAIKTSTGDERNQNISLKGTVQGLIKDITDYAKSMFMSLGNSIYSDQQGFVNAHEEVDKKRRIKHNGLITALRLLDTICKKYNVEPIYGKFGKYDQDSSPLCDPPFSEEVSKMRTDISSWALYVVTYAMSQETKLTSGYINRESKASNELNEMYDDLSIDEINQAFEENIKGR